MKITYTAYPNDNTRDVIDFINDANYQCHICGGFGEYETDYGPVGCNLCNSRLIPFIDYEGKLQTLDWNESVERKEDGLHKIENN